MGLRTDEEEEADQSSVSNITRPSSIPSRNNHHRHQQNQIQISMGHTDAHGDNNGNGTTTDHNDNGSIGIAGGVEQQRWWCRILRSTYILCVCSFLVSLTGGAILVLWVSKFHPSNRQLWMVPVGLILFGTPIFIWFSAFVSDLYCCPQPPKQQQQLQQNITSDGRSQLSFSDL